MSSHGARMNPHFESPALRASGCPPVDLRSDVRALSDLGGGADGLMDVDRGCEEVLEGLEHEGVGDASEAELGLIRIAGGGSRIPSDCPR